MNLLGFDHLWMPIFFQFGSLEEFQEEFRDINQEEQILRLHKMLAPHLLRSKVLKLCLVIVQMFTKIKKI